STTATMAPWLANLWHTARPIPDAPPVTNAHLSCSMKPPAWAVELRTREKCFDVRSTVAARTHSAAMNRQPGVHTTRGRPRPRSHRRRPHTNDWVFVQGSRGV